MKSLLLKEIKLATHPTNIIFLSLSFMMIIPNYQYYVLFFYTTLGIFFMCLQGRENHDIEYSLTLPVRKAQIVTARIGYAVILEIAQIFLAIPFAILRNGMFPSVNEVGMDANIALFGLSLLMLGLFNLLFFILYYRNPAKPGKAYFIASAVVMVYILAAESMTHVVPFFRDTLDTPDPQYLVAKLGVLALGAATFALLTVAAAHVSRRRFVALDL
ncbi:MAG: ABC-2 transporter permease [Eubacteriales bacterium]|nr:ABC-2 transporter permease [Eubacteriales bacterium]